MIDIKLLTDQSKLSLRKQCELLGLPRSTYYYTPKGESQENQTIMELMGKHILEEPTAGVLTMQSMLKDLSIIVSYERVRRLMKKAHIRPIYPRRHLTTLGKNKYIHPYLLKDLEITRPNQVWEVDITYIPMRHGFMYLAAVIDVYSRYIVGWGLSNSLDAESSLQVIREAVATHGEPEILNSDQGIQFTCKEYVNYLKEHGIKISMPACRSGRDGKGRALDNIYIERFWRTIKYQYIFLNPADNGLDLYNGIKQWIDRYHNRDHQGIERKKPKNTYQNAA